MKTYIIVARHYGEVTGEKIYHYNKMRYMLFLGWRVVFLSGKKEKTPFDGNENYSQLIFPALIYTPRCYSRREVKKTIDDIAAAIGGFGDDSCIIESDAVNRAVWAELIAKRIGAKHITFLLQEQHNYNAQIRDFLRFKYDRHELAGITAVSVKQIFGDDQIEPREDTRIRAMCQNVVEDCEDRFSPQLSKDAAVALGSIGRLTKRCVPAILSGFMEYAATHPEKNCNIVLIGGALGKKPIRQIRAQMKRYANIRLLITGNLYPIPASLLKNIDVFVSTAGSSMVSYRMHRPTVWVNPTTGAPVGILGLDDLTGKTMYDNMPDTTVAECIERALANADSIEYKYNGYEDYYKTMSEEFDRHLAIAGTVGQKEYYDDQRLMAIESTHIKGQRLHWIAGHVIGADGLNMFAHVYRVLRWGRR